MTIAIGLRSEYGIVLCADTEETTTTMKGPVEKITVHDLGQGRNLAYVGAGDVAQSDFMEERIVGAISQKRSATRQSDLAAIRREVKSAHETYFFSNPAWREGPTVAALAVLRDASGDVSLLRCLNGLVTTHPAYVSTGVGSGMADYWQRLLFPGGCKGYALEALSALAVFIVWQVKQAVPGCGGLTALTTFRQGGGYAWAAARFNLGPMEQEEMFRRVLVSFGVLVSNLSDPEQSIDDALNLFSTKTKAAVGVFRQRYEEMRRIVRVPKDEPADTDSGGQ